MKAEVYYNKILAGYLESRGGVYFFEYDYSYLNSPNPSISFSFPKHIKKFDSEELFPFFYGMLSEGANKQIQCKSLKIDERDDFTRLLKTAQNDTIGAITVKEI
jgi:serine/threonine-protein kinase HipA